MNRLNQLQKWNKAFYIPSKKNVGAGLQDRYGRMYIVYRDGSLRKIKDTIARTIVD